MLNIGDEQVEAQIDTGGLGLSLPESVARELKFAGDVEVIGRGNTQVDTYLLRGGTMKGHIALAQYDFKEPFIEINSVFPVANLGALPLQDFAVTFDQRSKLLSFASRGRSHRIGRTPMQASSEGPAGSPYAQTAAGY
jgi:hypothetical protein